MRDSRGLAYSTAMHVVFILLLVFGLPSFLHRQIEAEPESITVDILPIAPISNIKPQDEAPKEETKKPIADKTTEKKAAPETKKEEEKKEEKAEVVLPDKKKPEKKKPEKKKPEKKTEEDPLKAVLNDVKEHAKIEQSDHPTQQKAAPDAHKAKSQNYDASQPLSMSEKDAIRSQVESKWNAPAGAKDAQNLVVDLHIELGQDGTVTEVKFAGDQSRYSSDPFFRAAVDSAIRAVNQASPLKNLPADKYGTWREIDMTFDPHDAL